MNGKRTENNGTRSAWAWIWRNEVLLIGGLILAAMQYRAAHTAALIERLSLRITSFERSHERIADRLGQSITAVQEDQDRLADRLGQRITSLEKSQERIAGQLGARMTALEEDVAAFATGRNHRLERTGDKPGLPPPEAPDAAAAAPDAAGAAPG